MHEEFIGEFARHSRQLYGYIRTLVPDRNNADDVFQATSVVMWKKLGEYKPGTNFLAWACQIARYEICKMRDVEKRQRMLSDKALDTLCAEYEQRSGQESDRLISLSTCIEKLPPESKWLIEQRYYHERRPQAIADELGRSLASVYRGLARTHKWLLNCIENELAADS